MNEKKFREWLINKVDTQAPLSSYPIAIKKYIPEYLNMLGEYDYKNLFDCTDIEYLRNLRQRLLNNGDLHQFNIETQNRLPSAALQKYIDFLDDRLISKKTFYGLWIPKDINPSDIINSGIWTNKLSNQNRLSYQMEKFQVGDKVFLYQNIEDIKIKNSPFAEFLDIDYPYFESTIVKVKCYGIGKVVEINASKNSLKIKWDNNYKQNEWYGYFRQDGVWEVELDGSNSLQQQKYKALYDMVFNIARQDYKWWFDHGRLFRKNSSNQVVNDNTKIGSNMKTKNIILYGSPGVGKTHNINKLIKLIDTKEKSDNEIFEAIKNSDKSDSLDISDISHRVKFITFHQSFGYEDFIEGFRPDEEGNIGLVDGVFKEICKEASKNITKSFDLNKLVFDDALDSLLKDKIENSQTVRIDLNRDNSFFEIYDYNKKSIYYTRQGKSPEEKYHSLSISTLQTMYETESSDIITGGLKTYYRPLLKKLLEVGKQAKVEKTEQQNYYLVIDEINRGNISKIFGELITLIEESKRDKLEVILPYSKQRFKVPSNLYIIGTMNSTDKSIALIDIALRRRFTFLKMEPNADLIEDADAKEIFITLNKYIRDTLGDDYQIGHSYFMGDIDLDFVLEYKIKPLLEEYYYGDSRLSEVVKIIEEI